MLIVRGEVQDVCASAHTIAKRRANVPISPSRKLILDAGGYIFP